MKFRFFNSNDRSTNYRIARQIALQVYPGSTLGPEDHEILIPELGRVYVAAYSDACSKMAIVAHTGRDHPREVFGSEPWHAYDYLMLVQDRGDRILRFYPCPTRKLFDRREKSNRAQVSWMTVTLVSTKYRELRYEDLAA